MARVNTLGLNEQLRALNLLDEKVHPKVEQLLREGARLTATATKTAAGAHGLRRTGQMIEHIDAGNERIDSDGASIEVWPKGARRPKGRNAEVGFIQHYGRSYGKTTRAGTGFFDEGFNASEDQVQDLWDQGWSDLLAES